MSLLRSSSSDDFVSAGGGGASWYAGGRSGKERGGGQFVQADRGVSLRPPRDRWLKDGDSVKIAAIEKAYMHTLRQLHLFTGLHLAHCPILPLHLKNIICGHYIQRAIILKKIYGMSKRNETRKWTKRLHKSNTPHRLSASMWHRNQRPTRFQLKTHALHRYPCLPTRLEALDPKDRTPDVRRPSHQPQVGICVRIGVGILATAFSSPLLVLIACLHLGGGGPSISPGVAQAVAVDPSRCVFHATLRAMRARIST